jgi:hypothetical protein
MRTPRPDPPPPEAVLARAQAVKILTAALQRIADEYGDCRCEHDDENCCALVPDYCCPSCIATVALRSALSPRRRGTMTRP